MIDSSASFSYVFSYETNLFSIFEERFLETLRQTTTVVRNMLLFDLTANETEQIKGERMRKAGRWQVSLLETFNRMFILLFLVRRRLIDPR